MDIARELEIRATTRFSNNFDACADKNVIIDEITRLVVELERKSGKQNGTARNIKPIRGTIRDAGKTYGLGIQEWKITKRWRLIFDFSGALNLIDIAPSDTHTAVESLDRLSKAQLGKIFDSLSPVSDGFLALVLDKETVDWESTNLMGSDRDAYLHERFDDWIRFLDKPQQRVRDDILKRLAKNRGPQLHVVIGGPGTGKTMVLIDLALKYEMETGIRPSLQLPTGVKHYVAESGQLENKTFADDSPLALIDDPATFDALDRQVSWQLSDGNSVVVAIDPTQWHGRRTIEKFSQFINRDDVIRHELSLCYRQGGLTGRNAIGIVQQFLSKSSAFAADERVFRERTLASNWEKICLDEISFADDKGHFGIFEEDFDLGEVMYEQLALSAHFETVRNWPKVLIACPNKAKLPTAVQDAIDRACKDFPTLRVRIREYRQVTEVRGTEYETVLMLLRPEQLEILRRGVKGASTPEWESSTSLLAFLTRAENRLAILSSSEVSF